LLLIPNWRSPCENKKTCDEEEQRRRLKEEDWQIATPAEKRLFAHEKEGRKAGGQASKNGQIT
jgi:hypothetical protein